MYDGSQIQINPIMKNVLSLSLRGVFMTCCVDLDEKHQGDWYL